MSFIRRSLPVLFLGLAAVLPAWAARGALPPVPGEVIVQFKADAPLLRKQVLSAPGEVSLVQRRLSDRAAALGARIGRTLESGPALGDRMQVVRARGADAKALAARLAAEPDVEFAVPNGRQRLLAVPNDPLYAAGPAVDLASQTGGPVSGQWYLRAPTAAAATGPDDIVSAIGIEAAWARTRGSAGVVVAVLDTGVRFDHPDLGRVAQGGSLLPGYDFVSEPAIANDGNGRDADASDPGDWVAHTDLNNSLFSGCEVGSSSWHGTSTASLIGAATDNGLGMAGTAPGVRVLPVRVLGKCYGTDADIQAGMLWAAGLPVAGVPANPTPARVINMSLGSTGSCSAAYQSVVDRISAAGVMIVAAAGNTVGGPVGTPGNCRGVTAVLGLRHAGTKVGFSDLGPEIAIAAPGGNCVNIDFGEACLYPILTATNSGTQAPAVDGWTDSFNITVGTSFAAPQVAAVAALMVSQQPALTPAEVRAALQSTARPFPGTGADNGPDDPTPVPQCHTPIAGVEQLQCYCSTGLCGAGMMSAGAAVTAAAGAVARIGVTPATPTAGSGVTLDGGASLAATGATVDRYAWTLLDSGGIVTGFSSATNAATATLLPTAAGRFTVRLTVTDSLGHTGFTEQSVAVAAVPVVQPPSRPSGGGLVSAPWVGGVALAALALVHDSRRRRRGSARKPIP